MFLRFLVDHKAEAGDGGNFKKSTFQAAVAHLATHRRQGARKEVKTLQNKYSALRKTFRVVQHIKSVSGWHWDDEMGATIDVNTAASWDAYVAQQPAAKPFRNKGWLHFRLVEELMPSPTPGTHVFHPTSTNGGAAAVVQSAPLPPSSQSSSALSVPSTPTTPSPPSQSPPIMLVDDEAGSGDDGPVTAGSKISRAAAKAPVTHSHGSATSAINSISTAIVTLTDAMTSSLVPTAHESTPVRRDKAIKAFLKNEKSWLDAQARVAFIGLMRKDKTIAEVYLSIDESDVRVEWVRSLLEENNVIIL